MSNKLKPFYSQEGLIPVAEDIMDEMIQNYNNVTQPILNSVSAPNLMRNEIIFNFEHLDGLITQINWQNLSKIKVHICQVPSSDVIQSYPSHLSYFNNYQNQIMMLFYFLDENGNYYNDSAFDFQEIGATSFRALNSFQANDFFGKYAAGNQIRSKLNADCQDNTYAFNIPIGDYFDFKQDNLEHLKYFKIKFGKIDITAPLLKGNSYLKSIYRASDGKFNPIFYALNASKTRIPGSSVYDMNELCPPGH